jgi:hypothetical protein
VTPQAMAANEVPRQLAVLGSTVWYTTGVEVRQVLASGDVPTVIVPGQTDAESIAVDASGVYWANSSRSGAIRRFDAGDAVTLATEQATPAGISLDAQFVYWANSRSGEVMKLAK